MKSAKNLQTKIKIRRTTGYLSRNLREAFRLINLFVNCNNLKTQCIETTKQSKISMFKIYKVIIVYLR